MTEISSARILIVATDGFEESELMDPRATLTDRGATITLASIDAKPIQGEKGGERASTITPDMLIADAECGDYDAILLPGGVGNPDKLRMNDDAIALIRDFHTAGKPVAAICHAPWLLIEADLVDGVKVTGWPSVRTDLANAGGKVVDAEVVVDGNIITSRKPEDIPAFTSALIEMIEKAPAQSETV